jgi:GNAT superfamily N-acetyltransferase
MSGRELFAHPVDIDPAELRYEPFKQNSDVKQFDSGTPDLDEFLCTDEVREYERQNLGRTSLVYYQGHLVGYYTTLVDGLRIEYVLDKKTAKSYVKLGRAVVDKIPCVKEGRLAIQTEWKGKGIGRHIIRHIIGYALALSKDTAIRLIIAEAMPQSLEFYLKCGFQLTVETRSERKRRHRTVFFDLQEVVADAGPG